MTTWTDDEIGGTVWSDDEPTPETEIGSDQVTFAPSGSGAVARTVEGKLRDQWIDLADFLPAGYVTDGSVDYATQIASALSAASGKGLRFPTGGGTYQSSAVQTIPANTRVDLQGATLKFTIDGSVECLQLRDYSEVINGTVEVAGTNGAGTSGQYQAPVVIGNYLTGTGYYGCKVDVTIASNKAGGNGVFITGSSYAFDVKARVTANNSTLETVVQAHWGGATAPASGTFHPDNGRIHVECLDLTRNDAGVTPVRISACSNIRVSGTAGDITNGCAAIVTAGDYGAQYGTAQEQSRFLRGIVFENYAVESSLLGFDLDSQNTLGTVSLWKADIRFRDYAIKGNANTSAGCRGVDMTNVDGVVLEDGVIDGFNENIKFNTIVNRVRIRRNRIINSYATPLNTNTASSPAYSDVSIEDNEFTDNNTQGTASRGAVTVNAGIRWSIRRNTFDEPNLTWAVRVTNTTDTVWLYDNHAEALVGSGPAYSLGSSTDYSINAMGGNNTIDHSIATLYGGVPLFHLDGNGNRTFRAAAAPTTGTWLDGDIVWGTAPASGGSPGWVCTTTGTFSTATDADGDTDGSTAVITGMSDTSDFAVGQYVTVSAGFASTGPFKVLALTATTMTVSANSNSAQSNVTVATPDAVFSAMAVLA